jgi:hypothetical protein
MNSKKELVFTICSANYFAQAITLGNSLQATNSDVEFRIYLVDRLEGREEVRSRVPFPLIEIEEVPVTDFEGMVLRYNVVELNTSVKPYIFDHILKTELDIQKVVYLDPDIMVFQPLTHLFETLDNYNMVLTPHILTPSDNNPNVPQETSFLATGIFNLGFIAIKRSTETLRFLNWWKDKLIHQGYNKLDHHLFYDQKWLNFAPVFFEGVYIEKNRGYNMAPWNLHERTLNKKKDIYIVNDKDSLTFFHFSSYKTTNPSQISQHTKYTFDLRPDLKEVIQLYHTQLFNNGEHYFTKMTYFFSAYKIEIMRNNALNNSSLPMQKLRKLKYYIEEKWSMKNKKLPLKSL